MLRPHLLLQTASRRASSLKPSRAWTRSAHDARMNQRLAQVDQITKSPMDVGYAVTSATAWTGVARKVGARTTCDVGSSTPRFPDACAGDQDDGVQPRLSGCGNETSSSGAWSVALTPASRPADAIVAETPVPRIEAACAVLEVVDWNECGYVAEGDRSSEKGDGSTGAITSLASMLVWWMSKPRLLMPFFNRTTSDRRFASLRTTSGTSDNVRQTLRVSSASPGGLARALRALRAAQSAVHRRSLDAALSLSLALMAFSLTSG